MKIEKDFQLAMDSKYELKSGKRTSNFEDIPIHSGMVAMGTPVVPRMISIRDLRDGRM